ncbi:bifunctional enoyl-CoA hydratase/phosphate acetyltransferase [Fusibacter ferrireducens]|uniref:Bifunctional enoyl-CoA hydratase/phosphate acetyltransferase n=1 Tax=Fusibacter ferrireducens TaxID=2785058 RepID=A0ABR9ZQ50_9FIRM|nr:bifunctional enoyl-CoA hydratase/phosphate acetyltransferase [Fusibacter ferrireducens]MBF4692544.1 bifunctional enoyl-CoA hydratase/phosphate acetyltransferase [Fusibacter ferrireducens]
MVFKNFDELVNAVQKSEQIKKVVVVSAHEEHTIQAVLKAQKDRILSPIWIGDKPKIEAILHELDETVDGHEIIHVPDDVEAAELAVSLIHQNRADFIMKGKIQTADLLKAVVNKENGLGMGTIMSHFAINEIPQYHKLVVTTDGGMVMYPNLIQKKQIIQNAVKTLKILGYDCPKVAVLAAIETVNAKMPETVDADLLKKMNQSGEIENCIVEGPISYDLVMSRSSAAIKNYQSPIVGDADILVVPNITVGNILGKSLVYSAGAKMAGFVVGAKVPIVLTSRGSTSEEKYLSLVLAASVA